MAGDGQRDVRGAALEAATRLFAAHGYDGATLQAVADEVGVRKPSLLYWFKSKEELRDAVIDDILSRWGREIPRLVAESASGPDLLEGALGAALPYFLAWPDRARVLLRELLDRPAQMQERLDRYVGSWSPLVVQMLRRGQAEGRVRADVDPEAWLVTVLTLVVCSAAASELAATVSAGGVSEDRLLHEVLAWARCRLYSAVP